MQCIFVNVGYGDAILLQGDDGFTVLLDCGSDYDPTYSNDPYRIRLHDYLKQNAISHIDAVILSHIHEDHVCGLLPVLNDITIDALYVPYPLEPFKNAFELEIDPSDTSSISLCSRALNAYSNILRVAYKTNVSINVLEIGKKIPLGNSIQIKPLLPSKDVCDRYLYLITQLYSCENIDHYDIIRQLDAMGNAASLLLRVETNNTALLFAADNVPGNWSSIEKNDISDIKILKLPHHGQKDSIDINYMSIMPLKYVITTASCDRKYGSANAEVYKELTKMHLEAPPVFLFSDEREYSPYFYQPDGYCALCITVNNDISYSFIHKT